MSFSRNAASPSPVPRRPAWTSHLRQVSKTSVERPLEQPPLSPDNTVSSDSTIRDMPPPKPSRLDRRWTVTVNESFARDEVLLNLEALGDEYKPGTLVAIDVVKADTDKPAPGNLGKQSLHDRSKDASAAAHGRAADNSKRYICIIKDMTKDQKMKMPNVEVYVAKHIADVFGMRKGSQVVLTPVDSSNPAIEASHVELCFKDQYLSRSDMWRLAVGEMADRTVYKGQMILFLGSIKAQVTAVYVKGRKVQSAFFGRDTRPVFRSESARYVLFIQMSREMWDFDSDGSGEIMFNKVVNGFLPALFKKWVSLKVKHLVSIVLFARIEYDLGLSTELAGATMHNDYYTGVQPSGKRRPYKDFYRVVVSDMASGEWTTILTQLKKEFNFFRRDISEYHQLAMSSFSTAEDASDKDTPTSRIKPVSSRALYGNVLEAINMASTLFAHDYIDRDLMRTGISVVVITPSPGVFEVDYEALRRTTEALVGNGIGIDLICIPKMPLHSVPLFRYKNPQRLERANSRPNLLSRGTTPKQSTSIVGSYSSLASSHSPGTGTDFMIRGGMPGNAATKEEWCYALPQWLHVSYWTGTSEEALSYQGIALSVQDTPQKEAEGEFAIRCRMYDLQMRSVLETNEIETKPLYSDAYFPQAALRSGQPNSSLGIRNTKVQDTLFDHVYGFQKFAPDKTSKSSSKSIWRQLQEYDESRARLPTSLRSQSRRKTKERYHLQDDTGVLGTSYSERRSSTANQLVSSLHHGPERTAAVRPGAELLSRRDSDYAPKSDYASLSSKLSPTKAPKFMRQISLGLRGFVTPAPKAVVAEVTAETANASRTNGPSSVMTPIKAPGIKAAEPPPSRQTSSSATLTPLLESTTVGTYKQPSSFLTPETPSRPIVIRSPQDSQDPIQTTPGISGSILASTLRAELPMDDRDLKYSEAIRAEDEQKIWTHKLRAGAVPELPATLPPTAVSSPWLTVLNPSNPDIDAIDITTLYSRWQHVFPRPSEMRVMKWKSLCAPAAVPLTTEYFPTKSQVDAEFNRQPYIVSENIDDDDLQEEPKTREELLRELVGLRFSQGFQVVVGPAVAKAFGQKQLKLAEVFSRGHTAEDGTSIVMSVGNTIHQLSCANGTEIEINIFSRKPMDPSNQVQGFGQLYKPAIRTLLDREYRNHAYDIDITRSEKNWNYIDSFVAGHNDELSENLRFWRTRFVLIPMAGRFLGAVKDSTTDNDEEVRIEGIRKLALLWQKYRYAPEEKRFQKPGDRMKKPPNPLDIVYRTEDPSRVIAAELETLPLLEAEGGGPRKGQLVTNKELFKKGKFNMASLAEAIQQPVENGGIRMQNRRWHLRLHYNCFIGSAMTSWLLDNFEDIETREEAEAFGQRLMVSDEDSQRDKEKDGKEPERKGGLFVHVEKRHPFRDGQYFYQISSEYAKPHPGWFNSKRRDLSGPSVPATPMSEHIPRELGRSTVSRPTSIHEGQGSPISGATTPAPMPPNGKRPRVVLSKVIKYDVDHRKRSYRREVIDLHYDRLHNPDNCYHIRVDWMNVTAKLIEDAIESWAREAAQYSLRLVEVPIAEACTITDINPFRRPYLIRLAEPPPNHQPATYYDPNSLVPQAQPGRNFYQRAILKKFDFVLDMEAASDFPSNVDVSYSWGKPDFKYTQFIHRSGTVIAEITDEGDFVLLANRLYSNRAASAREKEMRSINDSPPGGPPPGPGRPAAVAMLAGGGTAYTPYGIAEPTPISSPSVKPAGFFGAVSAPSPVVRAVSGGGGGPSNNEFGNGGPTLRPAMAAVEPEAVKTELEAFCQDGPALDTFYRELIERAAAAAGTPPTTNNSRLLQTIGLTNVPEASIPSLGLPPGVLTPGSARGEEYLGGIVGFGSVGSSRVSSPHPAQLALRRGSVQDGILGLRMPGHAPGFGERRE
ncbi:hypothetical protein GE09DRAFT_373293 [Coniochaeta sp. 2T2.1]|nr:hypothetical protein GE09DRAFT_373293 [Coniochaeta sp. 2T2.1]